MYNCIHLQIISFLYIEILKKKVRWNANPNFNFVTFSVSILARLVQKIPIIILADVLANARLET